MTAYELMLKTNYYLIQGGELTATQKNDIADQLLAAKSTAEQAEQFVTNVKYPNHTNPSERHMLPIFFIPPYNDGKRIHSIFDQIPKTQILSANIYELEILRLLYKFAPNNTEINKMTAQTLDRLKTTCFGYADDGESECFDASIVVLRFLAAVSNDTAWMQSRIDNYNRHYAEKKRSWYCTWYYWLCLSELPFDLVKNETDKYKPVMLNWLFNKSCVMNSERDRTIHPVLLCMLRNNIARYPEYEYIKDRQPYVSQKDGRLYFNMEITKP